MQTTEALEVQRLNKKLLDILNWVKSELSYELHVKMDKHPNLGKVVFLKKLINKIKL